jgi:hypothetical protein
MEKSEPQHLSLPEENDMEWNITWDCLNIYCQVHHFLLNSDKNIKVAFAHYLENVFFIHNYDFFSFRIKRYTKYVKVIFDTKKIDNDYQMIDLWGLKKN